MKTIILMITCSVIGICTSIGQEKIQSLTVQQKQQDFEYLYHELKEAYPYFEINKRQHGVDWLGNKEKYRKKMMESKSDVAFFQALESIINDLNNGHTDMYPTLKHAYFYKAYKNAPKSYLPYVKELEKFGAPHKSTYWSKIHTTLWQQQQKKTIAEKPASIELPKANLHMQFDEARQLALLQVRAFGYEHIEKDRAKLKQFFNKAHRYKNLVIDIQGNTGGDDTYWIDNVIGHLIAKPITYPVIFAFKRAKRIRRFKPSYVHNASYRDLNLPKLPPELQTDQYSFRKTSNRIAAHPWGKKYQGNIYLLVDQAVYSSAESLAYFCRATRFATIVGQTTGGDGIGTDPLLLTLPNSGIVLRFTGEMALNVDGSANEEVKTIPDLILPGKTRKARLGQLMKMLDNKK